MPSWWGKPSSQDAKTKLNRGRFIDAIHRKFNNDSEVKHVGKSGSSERYSIDTISDEGSDPTRSAVRFLLASRCQSFNEKSHPVAKVKTPRMELHAWDMSERASVSSSSSKDTASFHISDNESANISAFNNPSQMKHKNQLPVDYPLLNTHLTKLHVPLRAGVFSAPDSMSTTPSRAPLRARSHELMDGSGAEVSISRLDDLKVQYHRLPRPPLAVPSPSSYSTVLSPTSPRNHGQAESLTSPIWSWKKGRLIGSGTYGQVYLGFNSESGQMCAMKEVTLFSGDTKSIECVQQLEQEISLLSRFRHPNIVRHFGSEMVDDKLYIYLEYVSGGSIHKLLREYGPLSESAICRYTQQILSGLAFLHGRNTVHRDIKGANILVDPTGQVKLADFGTAKHITGQSSPLSFKGTPYWMAPEVGKNTSGSNLAVDIWSLGCTVIEMATAKPPWSQYEEVPALFKIWNSKELPTIPDHLSEDGKDFVRQCLQRNPQHRPTALQLLQHSFIRNRDPLKRSVIIPPVLPEPPLQTVSSAANYLDVRHNKKFSYLKTKVEDLQFSKDFKTDSPSSSGARKPRHVSCPVSPIGSPLWRPKWSQTTSSKMISPPTVSNHREASAEAARNANGALPMERFTLSTRFPISASSLA